MEIKKAKPFIKWVGGKRQLLPELRKFYPEKLGSQINKYAEPFIGGGAVLFDILSQYSLDEVYISDMNKDLVNVYQSIKQAPTEVITFLKEYETTFLLLSTEKRRDFYNEKRRFFNQTPIISAIHPEKAALFIFLNKTCFNGLYRVNKKGEFNVPMGTYKSPCICDKENLLNVSDLLQKVQIHHGSYLDSENFIDTNTFTYIDPPYRPLTATSSFTSYTELPFGDAQQEELAEFARRLKARGSRVLLSNSDPKNTDENDNFFDNLYQGFQIERISATRMINSKGNARGKISELLIQC